jgi:ABC-2 type transport system ATP-binding protein
MNAVETQGLTKTYKTTNAVKSIDMVVPAGACCGFLGKNGAGKTTTLRMLTGLLRPTAGNISIMGAPQRYGRMATEKFGYLPDVPNFYAYMTGAEFLNLCGKLAHMDKPARKQRIRELLMLVGLEKTRTRIAGYSRGMKQRLGIAQAMMSSPPVIFMDEPISALDPIGRKDVADVILTLKEQGTTVIFSSHILGDVEHVCDYAVIIEKGAIIAQDTLHNLRVKHAGGAVRVDFYEEEHATRFIQGAGAAGIYADIIDPTQYLIKSATGHDMPALTMAVTRVLAGQGVPAKNFGVHEPSLEDIFYKELEVAAHA